MLVGVKGKKRRLPHRRARRAPPLGVGAGYASGDSFSSGAVRVSRARAAEVVAMPWAWTPAVVLVACLAEPGAWAMGPLVRYLSMSGDPFRETAAGHHAAPVVA